MSLGPLFGSVRAVELPHRVGVMVASLFIMVVAWVAAVTYFGEWRATWGSISIWIWGLIPVVVTCVILLALGWLRYPAANWMLWLIVIYLGLSIALGAWGTEAVTNGGVPRSVLAQEHTESQAQDDNYRYSRTGTFFYPYFYGGYTSSGSKSSSSTPACTGKSCGGAALVLIVLILLVGSTFVPHFWVIAALCAIVWQLLAIGRELTALDYARAAGPGADIPEIWGRDE